MDKSNISLWQAIKLRISGTTAIINNLKFLPLDKRKKYIIVADRLSKDNIRTLSAIMKKLGFKNIIVVCNDKLKTYEYKNGKK